MQNGLTKDGSYHTRAQMIQERKVIEYTFHSRVVMINQGYAVMEKTKGEVESI